MEGDDESAGERAAHAGAMEDAHGPAQQARLTELRRRLYRPDVTPDDLARYTALREALAEPAPERPAPSPRRSRRPALVGIAVIGAVAVCGAVAVLRASPSDPLAVTSTAAALPAQSRAPQRSERFSDDDATPVGTTVEVEVAGERVLAQRFSGSGPSFVPLVTGGAPLDGGRLDVTLTATPATGTVWRAAAVRDGSTSTRGLDPARAIASGAPGRTTTRYAGSPPHGIAVLAPAGTVWTLVVAFSR